MSSKKEFLIRCKTLLLASVIAFSSIACSKKEVKEDRVGIIVEIDDNKDEYQYFFNADGTMHGLLIDTYYSRLELLKITNHEKYTNDLNSNIEAMSTGFFNTNNCVVWPECFNHYSMNILTAENCVRTLDVKDLSGLRGNEFKLVTNSIEFKKDIDNIYLDVYTNENRQINKGDKIEAVALLYEDEVIAFKQTGVGSDCENVTKTFIGDIDSAIYGVDTILSSDTEYEYDEIIELLDSSFTEDKEPEEIFVNAKQLRK